MDPVLVDSGQTRTFTVPTETAESDGTFRWASTTMVLVELCAGDEIGLGYTYAHPAAAAVAQDLVRDFVIGQNALDGARIWGALVRGTRNLGRNGLGAMAVSAVDNSLWDLRAKLAGLSLRRFLGAAREKVPVYGSGGFTSLSRAALAEQLAGWVAQGIPKVKMKIGLGAEEDLERALVARRAIGAEAALFVDANEAYDVKTSLALAEGLATLGVSWFEQPVHNDAVDQMRFLRSALPAGMALATGEYASSPDDFLRFLTNGAADVLQPDATRCQGITGFLKAAALCEAFRVPVSSHCAPSLHAHLGSATANFLHLEYFADHVRIENLLFDEPMLLRGGFLHPDDSRPGLGLVLRAADAERFAA